MGWGPLFAGRQWIRVKEQEEIEIAQRNPIKKIRKSNRMKEGRVKGRYGGKEVG